MKGDLRCEDGRLFRHDPQWDDPDLETHIGTCPECEGRGCPNPDLDGPPVYVVMGNDFPDAVFADRKAADAYVGQKKRELPGQRPIYWRVWEFKLQGELEQ